jgi:hypothetical protein
MKLPIAANDNVAPKLDPLLRLATVIEATGLSRSTIYRPPPVIPCYLNFFRDKNPCLLLEAAPQIILFRAT